MTSSAEMPGARTSRRLDGAAARSWLASARGELLVALVLYAAYSVFLTWPLAEHPGTLLSGISVGGDLGGSVSSVQESIRHGLFPFAPGVLHGVDAPQGLHQAWVENWASFPGNVLLYGLGWIFGAVGGSNAFLWLSYVLTGLSMFLLIRRLYGSFGAALLAGFAFAFFPWAVDKLNGHYQYMDGWVLVLGVWRMLELTQRPTARNALLAGAATALAMWWTPYFIIIAGVGFVVQEVVLLVVAGTRDTVRRAVAMAALAVVPIAIVFVALGLLDHFAGGVDTGSVRAQSIQDLYTFSARGLEWVLPDRNNAIFGGATGPYLLSHLHGSNFSESSLYLGDSVIVLATAGVVLAVRRWISLGRRGAWDPRVVAAVSGLLVAAVAAWFSAPPKVHVLGAWIPTPSDVVFHVTSTWRVYTRFVELIELGLCIPAGWMISVLIARRRAWMSVAAFGAVAAVLVLDLWARPPGRTVSTALTAPYVWLHEHPGGIVADYPIEPADYPDYSALFYGAYDDHPLLQGYAAGSEDESAKLDLGDIAEPRTASYLAALGVRYVVVRPGQPGATLATVRKYHYRIVFSSPEGSVWRVGARPARVRVDALDNFSIVEGDPGEQYRWMVGDGTVGIVARNCASCTGTLVFDSNSNAVPRVVTVRQGGRVLGRTTVSPTRLTAVVASGVRLHDGHARVTLTTSPGPAAVPGGGDPRLLSINFAEPAFRLAR